MIDNSNKKYAYWQYQYLLGKNYLIPLFKEWGITLSDIFVLDIGCAEGGVLCACAEENASGLGLEIAPSRLFFAIQFAKPNHLEKISFIGADLFFLPIKTFSCKPDLVLLRDVFEHLPNRQSVMKNLKQMMSTESKLLITFPPFYAPFGGHQQMLQSFLRFIPYFHVLPKSLWQLFRWYISHCDGNPTFLNEMDKLRRYRVSIHGFKKLAKRHNLQIINKRFYISRPSYRLRFGWPVIKANLIGRIPFVREFLISGAFFLLEREEG